ncbi:MAG: glycosyl transferase, WecB/TagA/CpsF family [Acidobacteriaceae bacterium]|jgi:N-acetylglucosaminyldiphosphoundecaprenol N-acetyl-beta-D-mannosaminyltransferase|nr:glycosyl transferase, WecB/TagA/CpsF family [Acidobacteriaceae bacterium]
MAQLDNIVADAVENRRRVIIGNHNLHSIYQYHHDPKMRQFYELADHIHVDGMAVIGCGRLLGMPLRREHRVTYADWMDYIAKAAAENGWRVFYLGSLPGVAERGAEILRRKYPGLMIRTCHGFFDATPGSLEAQTVLSKIEAWQPHLLITGMGMPRQEHWIVEHAEKLSANVVMNGGAALDYFAGAIPTPPRWAGRIGFEWLFRLLAEPRRLWKRYLVEPWFILYKVTLEIKSRLLVE